MTSAIPRFAPVGAAILGAGLLSLILYAPALPQLVPTILSGHSGDFDRRLPFDILAYLAGFPFGFPGLFVAGVALGGLAWGLRNRFLEAVYVTLLFAVPIGAVWLARPEYALERFFTFLLPFVSLGLALAGSVGQEAARADGGWRRTAALAAAILLLTPAAWLWASRPWRNVPTGAYREAVEALEAPAARPEARVGTCAIGRNTKYYAWYAKRPVLVPASAEEFEAFLASHDGVRCAWVASPAALPAHRTIAAILERKCGPPTHYLGILVYRCGD